MASKSQLHSKEELIELFEAETGKEFSNYGDLIVKFYLASRQKRLVKGNSYYMDAMMLVAAFGNLLPKQMPVLRAFLRWLDPR